MGVRSDSETWTQAMPSPWARTLTCPQCGAEYTVNNRRSWPWRIPGKKGTGGHPAILYCSRRCMREAEDAETRAWMDETSKKPMEV